MNLEFEKLRVEAYPYNIILSVISLVASIITIILCLLMNLAVLKKGFKVLDFNMKMMMITIIFDLMEAITILVLSINALLHTDKYLSYELGCKLLFLLLTSFAITSVNLTSIVALDRYLIIVFGIRLEKKYYYQALTFFCILNTIGIIIGWNFNGIKLLPSTIFCFQKYSNFGGLLSQGIAILSIGLSTAIIYFCYIGIMIQRKKQLEEIRDLFPDKFNPITRQINLTIIKSGSLILASTISNLPYCIISIISMIHPEFYTAKIDTIRCTLIMLNMITNSLLLLGMRSDLLSQFKSLLGIKSEIDLNNNFNNDAELI